MTKTQPTRQFKRPVAILLAASLGALATTAHAQDDEGPQKGLYGVVRAGAAVDAGQKFDDAGLPTDVTFDRKTRNSAGFTGELGVGYKFGMFRLEQTFGYTGTKANHVTEDGFTGGGRTNAYTVLISGYVDIPTGSRLVPYVGAGIGAARVQSHLARTDDVTGDESSYSGTKWGLAWHADAGLGYRVSPRMTAELGARYTSISKVSFDGESNGDTVKFKPEMGYWSALAGLRYAF